MAKKKKGGKAAADTQKAVGTPSAEGNPDAITEYYHLNTDAMDKLLSSDAAPEVSEKEIRRYTGSKKKFHIPEWVKILFVKFWFAGAICYFFLWGLGTYVSGLDLMFIIAVGLGLATDLLANRMLRSFEKVKGSSDRWIMVTVKKFWSIFINIIYAGVILFCIVWFYNAVNTIFAGELTEDSPVVLPVEPILFGLLYAGFDMLFILIKNTFIKIFRDAAGVR